LVERLCAFRGRLPDDFKFDCGEANDDVRAARRNQVGSIGG
jgi:hypothetical protein